MADQAVGASIKMDGVARIATGHFTSDGNGCEVTLGFRPRHVIVFNVTGVVRLEKIDGMADATTIKTVTGGTLTAAAGSLIVIDDHGFNIATAELAASDVVAWSAWG